MINWIYNFLHQKVNVENIEDHCENQYHVPIVWLHGAGQTSSSWKYIREKVNYPNEILIDYSCMNRFYDNLQEMIKKINNSPVIVIGHSLGGLYGIHLTKHCNVISGISISTPFNGSSAADWAKYVVPNYPVFRDIGKRSNPVLEAKLINLNIPWTQVVTTGGKVPYLNGPNDGVCTVSSMKCVKNMKFVETSSTHYEVMVDDMVVELIRNELDRVNQYSSEYFNP